MNTDKEKIEWERDNFHKITGWSVEYDTQPGTKVITFNYTEAGEKMKKIFVIICSPDK